MGDFSAFECSTNGYPIVSHEVVKALREADKNVPNPLNIIAQEGGQEKLLLSPAQITIYGGCRGAAKSFTMLLEALNDVYNPEFKSIIVRKEKNDLSDLIDTSRRIFTSFGDYNRSKDDMTWNFLNGGFLKFDYYAGSYDDFKVRFQGKQFAYIGIDEITHMEYRKFKYLLTDNRNAAFLRNRLIGTCNPDPDSWVAKFIDWWIDEDGLPNYSRAGVVRYCFMQGEGIQDIIWGDSREEVYEKCRDIIDPLYLPELRAYGTAAEIFIKSVCFIPGKLAENIHLLRSDPSYIANLANQDEQSRARDLEGNWKYKSVGDDLIKLHHMDAFFDNAFQRGNATRRVSCDLAFTGGDNLVMWLWEGFHIQDILVARYIDGSKVVDIVNHQLDKWGVTGNNFVFDASGTGEAMKGFVRNAIPFNNREAPIGVHKGAYDCVKSQCAFMFAEYLIDGRISINPDLLSRKFSGKGFSNLELRDILLQERKAICADENREDAGQCLIRKPVMKQRIGHSPDFIEALIMRMIFELKTPRKIKGLGFL